MMTAETGLGPTAAAPAPTNTPNITGKATSRSQTPSRLVSANPASIWCSGDSSRYRQNGCNSASVHHPAQSTALGTTQTAPAVAPASPRGLTSSETRRAPHSRHSSQQTTGTSQQQPPEGQPTAAYKRHGTPPGQELWERPKLTASPSGPRAVDCADRTPVSMGLDTHSDRVPVPTTPLTLAKHAHSGQKARLRAARPNSKSRKGRVPSRQENAVPGSSDRSTFQSSHPRDLQRSPLNALGRSDSHGKSKQEGTRTGPGQADKDDERDSPAAFAALLLGPPPGILKRLPEEDGDAVPPLKIKPEEEKSRPLATLLPLPTPPPAVSRKVPELPSGNLLKVFELAKTFGTEDDVERWLQHQEPRLLKTQQTGSRQYYRCSRHNLGCMYECYFTSPTPNRIEMFHNQDQHLHEKTTGRGLSEDVRERLESYLEAGVTRVKDLLPKLLADGFKEPNHVKLGNYVQYWKRRQVYRRWPISGQRSPEMKEVIREIDPPAPVSGNTGQLGLEHPMFGRHGAPKAPSPAPTPRPTHPTDNGVVDASMMSETNSLKSATSIFVVNADSTVATIHNRPPPYMQGVTASMISRTQPSPVSPNGASQGRWGQLPTMNFKGRPGLGPNASSLGAVAGYSPEQLLGGEDTEPLQANANATGRFKSKPGTGTNDLLPSVATKGEAMDPGAATVGARGSGLTRTGDLLPTPPAVPATGTAGPIATSAGLRGPVALGTVSAKSRVVKGTLPQANAASSVANRNSILSSASPSAPTSASLSPNSAGPLTMTTTTTASIFDVRPVESPFETKVASLVRPQPSVMGTHSISKSNSMSSIRTAIGRPLHRFDKRPIPAKLTTTPSMVDVMPPNKVNLGRTIPVIDGPGPTLASSDGVIPAFPEFFSPDNASARVPVTGSNGNPLVGDPVYRRNMSNLGWIFRFLSNHIRRFDTRPDYQVWIDENLIRGLEVTVERLKSVDDAVAGEHEGQNQQQHVRLVNGGGSVKGPGPVYGLGRSDKDLAGPITAAEAETAGNSYRHQPHQQYSGPMPTVQGRLSSNKRARPIVTRSDLSEHDMNPGLHLPQPQYPRHHRSPLSATSSLDSPFKRARLELANDMPAAPLPSGAPSQSPTPASITSTKIQPMHKFADLGSANRSRVASVAHSLQIPKRPPSPIKTEASEPQHDDDIDMPMKQESVS